MENLQPEGSVRVRSKNPVYSGATLVTDENKESLGAHFGLSKDWLMTGAWLVDLYPLSRLQQLTSDEMEAWYEVDPL